MVQSYGVELIPSSLTTTPWQVRVAKFVFDQTGDKKFKSVLGPQGWNKDLVDKLNNLFIADIARGADRVLYMSANSGVSQASVNAFIRAKNDPQINKDVREGPAADLLDFIRGVYKIPIQTTKAIPWMLIILAGGVAAYFVFMGKQGAKLV